MDPDLKHPWVPIAAQQSRVFEQELESEITDRHRLSGVEVTAVARKENCDDVLFQETKEGKRFFVVRLAWCGDRESGGFWPHTEEYSTFDEWRRERMFPDSVQPEETVYDGFPCDATPPEFSHVENAVIFVGLLFFLLFAFGSSGDPLSAPTQLLKVMGPPLAITFIVLVPVFIVRNFPFARQVRGAALMHSCVRLYFRRRTVDLPYQGLQMKWRPILELLLRPALRINSPTVRGSFYFTSDFVALSDFCQSLQRRVAMFETGEE